MNEVWKNKLIFVETPDANETSIALENYRRVSTMSLLNWCDVNVTARRAIMDGVRCSCLWHEARYRKESILITTMDVL